MITYFTWAGEQEFTATTPYNLWVGEQERTPRHLVIARKNVPPGPLIFSGRESKNATRWAHYILQERALQDSFLPLRGEARTYPQDPLHPVHGEARTYPQDT